jgi:hypothetical protein
VMDFAEIVINIPAQGIERQEPLARAVYITLRNSAVA